MVQWNPATLDEAGDEKINLVFKPLEDDIELHIPETEENRSVQVMTNPTLKLSFHLSFL